MTDEEIKSFRYGFLVAALLLMKHRMERDYLLEHLPEIFNFVESDPSEGSLDNRIENVKYALRYLQGLKAIKWREAKAKLHSLNITYQVMDVLEEIKIESFQEGLEEGIEKGMEKGMEKGIEKGREEGLEKGILKEKFFACRNMLHQGFANNLIAGILEVSTEYVQQVNQQLGKEEQVAHLLKSGEQEDSLIADTLEVSPFLVEAVRKMLNKMAE